MGAIKLRHYSQKMNNKTVWTILVFIFLLGLALRLWGIEFGLPYPYHPDERGHVVEAARMAAAKTLEPSTLAYPPFYAYILMAVDGAYLGLGLLKGQYRSINAFADQIAFDPSPLYLLGRVASALFGTLTILVVYAIGEVGYSRRVGLLAGWSLAVAFLAVRESHYAVNDALLMLLVTLSLFGSVLMMTSSRLRGSVLAGLVGGLGFATKYTAAALIVPIGLSHWMSIGFALKLKDLKSKVLFITFGLFVVGAILGSPYFLLKPIKVVQDVASTNFANAQQGFEGWQIDNSTGYVFYLKTMIWGLGFGSVGFISLGLVLTLVQKQKTGILLLSFALPYYLFMGSQKVYFARLLLPMIPMLLIFAAVGIDALVALIVKRYALTPSPAKILLFVIVLLASIESLSDSIRSDFVLTQKDTRTIAKEWVEANIAADAKIAMDWPHHTPFLSTTERPEPNSSRTFKTLTIGGHGLSDHGQQYYKSQGFEYLVASSFIYQIPLTDSEKNSQRNEFYATLDRELTLVQEFKPYQGNQEPSFIFDEIYGPAVSLWQRERPGPTLKIYSVAR